jgi:branched-chain amino acid aminotransferase
VTGFSGLAWVEGAVLPLAEARVPVTDRSFLYADSIYDTVRTYGRRPFLLGDHIDRLRRSGAELGLAVPWDDEELFGIVDSLMSVWPDEREASLRVIVTRGDGGHGLALPEPTRPRLVVMARLLDPHDPRIYLEGARLGRPPANLAKLSSIPAHVKSGSYLANVLALQAVRQRGAFEGLLRGADGSWSEATTSNVFVVRDSGLHTPGAKDQILPGVTRALVLALAREAGIPVKERPLYDADLESADEIFLTSSIKEILPIAHLDDIVIGGQAPGPVTQQLLRLYRRAVERILRQGALRLHEVFPG